MGEQAHSGACKESPLHIKVNAMFSGYLLGKGPGRPPWKLAPASMRLSGKQEE